MRKEKDIERLRQVAVLLDSQIKHLLDVLASKCSELDQLKGTGRELQLALALIEQAKKEAATQDDAKPAKDRKGPRGGAKKDDKKL